MPRAPKKIVKWYPGSPKFNENEARGTQWGTNGKKSKKRQFFGLISPPIWASILTHFRLKMGTSNKLMAFLGDLEPTHIYCRNFFKTRQPRTPKMCLKHSKYAVGCKVGSLQKKSSKRPARAPFWRPLGSLWGTLGTKWHPRGHFLRGWNFDAKTALQVKLWAGGGSL